MEEVKKDSYNQEALENILEHDFSSDENFDIEESYKNVCEFEEMQEKSKLSKEDEIIDYLGSKYVEPEFYEKINKLRKNIKNYLKKYDVNSDYIKSILDNNPEDDELNRLFGIVKFMLNTFNRTVEDLNFVFRFSKKEYNMVNDILTKKSEVSGQEVLLQGMNNLIEEINKWKDIYKETQGDELHLPLSMNSTYLMYHFLSKKTVKGFSEQFYTLRSIMAKLKEASDVFEAYKTVSERLKTDFSIWCGAITPLNEEKKEEVEEEVKSIGEQ